MTRAEILILCQDLCLNNADADTLAEYYDKTVEDLARRPKYPLIGVELTSTDDTADDRIISFPDDALGILAAFFNDRQLSLSSKEDLNTYDTDWDKTGSSGVPFAFNVDTVDDRQYKIYPKPTADSDDFIFTHGEPFGEDYPANAFVTIFTSQRQSNIPDHIALCIAFKTLAREFEYPSDHTDIEFSKTCDIIGELLWKVVGL